MSPGHTLTNVIQHIHQSLPLPFLGVVWVDGEVCQGDHEVLDQDISRLCSLCYYARDIHCLSLFIYDIR